MIILLIASNIPHHLDSPLEIDFTDLRIEKSIQYLYVNIVVYIQMRSHL